MQSPTPNSTVDNYGLLVEKLREFKSKYYYNQALRGGLLFLAIALTGYLLITGLEAAGRFDTVTRTSLFWGFILGLLFVAVRYIGLPLSKRYSLGNTLTDAQAASIIGQHFGEVQDKLLNTLQLKAQANAQNDPFRRGLIEAGINQKIGELKPIPFVLAVDFKGNKKYLKYVAVPLLILLLALLIAPSSLLNSTSRLVAHATPFEEPAPFTFYLQNQSLTGIRGEDFKLQVKVKGSEIPAEVYVSIGGKPARMSGENKTEFSYDLSNLQEDVDFRFTANGVLSRPYTVSVRARPLTARISVALQYPAYLGRANETLVNPGDISLPAGTSAQWRVETSYTDTLMVKAGKGSFYAEKRGQDLFVFSGRYLQDQSYSLLGRNKYLSGTDSSTYQISVLADAYPTISAEQERDSTTPGLLYFAGQVGDDYGVRALQFVYNIQRKVDSLPQLPKSGSMAVPITGGGLLQSYFYTWDINSLSISPGDKLEYYLEVYDNDGVNGSKRTRSQAFTFEAPTQRELTQQTQENRKDLENRMTSVMRQAGELQKDLQDARNRLLNKNQPDWQDKKFMEDLMKRQENLQKNLQDLSKQYEKNLKQENQFKTLDPELLQKHLELQEMLSKVMDEETKKLVEQLQKLMQNQDKEGLTQNLEQQKLNDAAVQKELDRMLELYKQLAFEQTLENITSELEEIAKEQEELAKQAEDQKNGTIDPALKEKQEELKERFDDVRKQLDELQKQNEELENQNPLEDTEAQEEGIEKDQEESGDNLDKGKNSKAAQNAKDAAQKAKDLQKKLEKMQEEAEEEAAAENYESLRQIMDNLLYVSLEQEKVMERLGAISGYNPQYVLVAQEQRKIKDDARLIEDSLTALAKRVPDIASFITKEVGEMNFHLDKGLEELGLRDIGQARAEEQYAMTSMNNLAVWLSEVMKDMQSSMMQKKQGGKPGAGKPKPGKGKGQGEGKGKGKGKGEGEGGMGRLRSLQQGLNQQIQQLQDAQKTGQQGLSQQMAKMAAQQEALRRALQQMQGGKTPGAGQKPGDQPSDQPGDGGQGGNEGKDGMGGDKLQEIQDLMDKTEEDILNKTITEETIKRQQEIVVKMLEAENAEKQQDFDEKRKADVAKEYNGTPPALLQKYQRLKAQELESLRTVPPALHPYYRDKVKKYFEGR